MKTTNENESADPSAGRPSALVKLRSLLSVRDHTDYEVRSKLSAHYSDEEITSALNHAHAQGWLQTPEEQSARIAAKLAAKNKGIAFINETLENRGLPPLPFVTSDEMARARELLDSKLARGARLDYESSKKFYRLLASRGFEEDVIQSVLQAAGFEGQDEF